MKDDLASAAYQVDRMMAESQPELSRMSSAR